MPRWRESDVFTPLEREVMEYAEAMSDTPPTVTDEMSASAARAARRGGARRADRGDRVRELTTRGNIALGIESEGFSAACDLKPLAERPAVASPA